jgi:alpha-L-fucosidase
MFLHWGISSARAMNISWPMIPGRPLARKHIEDPKERERIITEMDFNLNGQKPKITPLGYWAMAEDFNPDNYHPEQWLQKVKDAGFTYVVLTAKHHEGFALWPSEYGNFNTKNFMGGKDLIRPYVQACRKVGLKVGLYYSGPDWYFDQDHMNFLYYRAARKNPEIPPLGPDLKPRTKKVTADEVKEHQAEYARIVRGQIEELLSNYGKIDLIWFDGKPPIPNGRNVISQERIRELQPEIVINPRMHGKGDFITYERHLPETQPEKIQWAEFCNPWNGNWPYVERPYKTLGHVLSELVRCRAWGINYLLGIGPMGSGDLAPEAYENIEKLGRWMRGNREAISDVRPLPTGETSSILVSAKGNKRYLYLLPQYKDNRAKEEDLILPGDLTITLEGIISPLSVHALSDGRKLEFAYAEKKMTIKVPARDRSDLVDVICVTLSNTQTNIFEDNLAPAPIDGSFKMKDYIIWGGSVTKGEDGRYYMFASRWPKKVGMRNWVVNSEVVLASADKAEGPYKFEKVILPPRGPGYWDGMVTHNPTIHRHNGKYVLFYVGSTYEFERPEAPVNNETYGKVWNGKRVGVAVADSPFGPWKRLDEPILQPRPGKWDGAIISNPAPVIHEDGSVLLIYKSAPVPYPERNKNRALHFGVAKAPHYLGPYKRIGGGKRINIGGAKDAHVEDPYMWCADESYHMVAKIFSNDLTGESGAGFYAYSKNGIEWSLPENPKAYSRTVLFSDGTRRNQAKLERPQVLVEDGKPTHIFFATADPKWADIYNLVIPLKRNTSEVE